MRPAEFRGYRVPQHENRERFEEAREILTRAWTQETFSFEGQYYKIPELRVIPKPVQQPQPTIYQVSVSKESMENTALDKAGRTDTEKRWLLERWGVSRHIYVADTDAQALAETKEVEMWYQESLRKFQIPERIEAAHPSLQPAFRAQAERLAKVNWDDLVREAVAFGSPDTVARHIATMRDMGIGQILCWMNFGGLPQDKIRKSMELFAREVMPRFR